MSLKNILNRASRLIKEKNWSDLAKLSDRMLEGHLDQLSYNDLVACANALLLGAQYEHALRLAKAAVNKDPRRLEAPEIMFFIMLKKQKTNNAEQILNLLMKRSEHSKYLEWKILLLNQKGDFLQVIDLVKSGSVRLDPNGKRFNELLFSYVISLLNENRVKEARAIIADNDQFIDRQDAGMLHLFAKVAQTEGNCEEALRWYDLAVARAKGKLNTELRWNRALALLACGQLERGWSEYEVRWQWDDFTSARLEPAAQAWRGEALTGKSIVIWGEQGVGDEIMFLNLIPELERRDPSKICIAVSEKLVDLIRRWYPDHEVISKSTLASTANAVSRDFHLPAGSLPLMLGIYDCQGPRKFLTVSDRSIELRQNILNRDGATRVVGLHWRSSLLTFKRVGNYLSVDMAITLAREAPSDIVFIALQYAITDEERQALEVLTNVVVPTDDFFGKPLLQAEYVQACDLVVTCSSICVQIAGISNTPLITWGPDRSWVTLGFERCNPWYRNMHYVRCEQNWDFGALVFKLRQLLQKFYALSNTGAEGK
jgi:tetratricopeptide (TPR) repeat protein